MGARKITSRKKEAHTSYTNTRDHSGEYTFRRGEPNTKIFVKHFDERVKVNKYTLKLKQKVRLSHAVEKPGRAKLLQKYKFRHFHRCVYIFGAVAVTYIRRACGTANGITSA